MRESQRPFRNGSSIQERFKVNRRDLLRLAGAGSLTTVLSGSSDAEASGEKIAGRQGKAAAGLARSSLMQKSHRTAAASDSLDESYFWLDGHTLLFLRRAPGKTVFRAVLVDALTGRETLPQP